MSRPRDFGSSFSDLPPGCLLFHSRAVRLDGLEARLEAERIALRPAERLLTGDDAGDAPSVLLIDQGVLEQRPSFELLPPHVTLLSADDRAAAALGDQADGSLTWSADPQDRLRVLRTAFRLSAARRSELRAQRELSRSRNDLSELNRTGMALMMERDRDVLLQQIVKQGMRLTASDAGALFLLEENDLGPPLLRFKVILCDSIPLLESLGDVAYPLDATGILGHVALTGTPLVLEDVHHLPADASYRLNPLIEERFGYWIKSMLTVPMISQRGAVVGVLQLANRKSVSANIRSRADAERCVVPYSDADVQLGFSLAGQAAVSIENAQLYAQIDHLFECFVKAAVTAIDQRDPSTAGHSIRVATLVVDLASALERAAPQRVHFTREQLRELRYAALLHDFGKIGVREELLMKAKKVPPRLWERIESRFDLIRCSMTAEYHEKRAALSAAGQPQSVVRAMTAEFREQLSQLDRFRSAIRAANEPWLLPAPGSAAVREVASRSFLRLDGRREPYISAEELRYLQIPCGSLDEAERREVEAHARHTFDFLSHIPWTDDLKHIPEFASGHHEKLNGSGYPSQLAGDEIPLQSRILAVADIFDALTAADRPYKSAVSPEKALDVIRSEANAGLLDADVVQTMIASQVYRRVLTDHWSAL